MINELFPDTYMCHKLMASKLTGYKSVLDIGGIGRLKDFTEDIEITDANIKYGIDGCALPYSDKAFDVAVSINTLEHVRPSRRIRFLSESMRVSGCAWHIFPIKGIMRKVEELKKLMGHSHPIAGDMLPDLDSLILLLELDGVSTHCEFIMPACMHLAFIAAKANLDIYKEVTTFINDNLDGWVTIREDACAVILKLERK